MTWSSQIVADRAGSAPHPTITTVPTSDTLGVGTDRTVQRTSTSVARIASFDFVKGALVLVMILYHCSNYFIGLHWGGYRYLRFLTTSFIFITGFLVSYVYLSKYSYDDPRLCRKMGLRGLKLLTLFVALNVVADRTLGMRLQLNLGDSYALREAAYAVFVEGTAHAAFDILVSISYFLLLAPLVLFISGRFRIRLWVFAAAAVMATVVAEFSGLTNPHCEMLSVAMVGLAAGTFRGDRAATLLRSPLVIIAAYVIYAAAITVWNVTFSLQVVGVCVSVLALYTIAEVCGSSGLLQRCVIRLGQYSLLAYVAQIVVLQVLRRGLKGHDLSGAELAVPLAIGVVATFAVVQVTAWLRVRHTFFDRSYRIIFA